MTIFDEESDQNSDPRDRQKIPCNLTCSLEENAIYPSLKPPGRKWQIFFSMNL